ncbi:MAG TPA: alpha/beta hydrolase [Allosphingosinicella sp.]|nr:alpha/beta hydrolase [Allosphingosinicella sp.]
MLRRLIFLALAAAAASTLTLTPPPAAAAATPARAEAPAPTRFSVTVEGKGPDLILIPGLMSGREVWDDAVASLGGKYRIHRLKLSGFAGEPGDGNKEGAIVDGVVEQLDAYIKANGLKRPAIAGHSMGGLTAMLLAARHPESVGRVMVVDALPFYSLLFGPDATAESVAPQAAAFRDSVVAMDEAAWKAGQPRTAATLVKTESARGRVIADAEASDRPVAARAIYEVMTTDARPLLPRIEAPLTIVYATNEFAGEAMVVPLYRAAYAGAPKAKLVQVPDSYHFIMYDQPERFRALLAEFLAGGTAQ